LLPKRHLRCRRDGSFVVPCFLEPEHDAWIASVIRAFEDCEGLGPLAVEERASGLSFLRVHPRLDPIRPDPRYRLLLARVKLDKV